MSESAIDRTSRALDLIPFISKNPGWTIAELAVRFETTPAQIIRDLEMLFMCGLPGHSHSELIDLEIEPDYVAVRNPQNLAKPRRFTVTEVYALLLGLHSLESTIVDIDTKSRVERLKSQLHGFLSDQNNLVAADQKPISDIDSVLISAAQRGQAAQIRYRSARTDTETERVIHPQSFYKERDFIYFVAFCENVQEVRHFRSDRIMDVKILERIPTISPTLAQPSSQTPMDSLIHVSLSTRNRFFIEEHSSIVSEVVESAGRLTVTFSLGDVQWLLKALIALPGEVEILEPATFRDTYRSKIDAIRGLYR